MSAPPFLQKLSGSSDELLLEQMRTGEMHAFNTLFARHSRRGVELAATIVSDHYMAEEIVSDVFFSFWMRRQELPPIPSFQSYLFTAIRYRARKIAAPKKGGARIVALENYTITAKDSPADPFGQLHSGEMINTLQKIIEQLPPQRKLIFKLNRIDGLSYKAIAELMNIAESTVKNQLAAAIKTLRSSLSVHDLSLPLLLLLSIPL
jgi:RNA polymerase sigma-70 factor (ECF subfamily)